MSDADHTDPAAALVSVFLDAAGPGLENQLKALRGIIDGYSNTLDEVWTGDVVQSFADAPADSASTVHSENARLFDELAALKESAVMLTAVLSRILSTRRENEMEKPQ